MKFSIICSLLVTGLMSMVQAQDPGFQPARIPSQQPAPQAPAQASTGGDEVRSAGLINSMEQLDNGVQLQADDQISFRIIEDRGSEAIRLRIQDSGDIQAPHVGLVRAAGRTCRELAFAVKKELEKSYYQTATVIIALDIRPKQQSYSGAQGGGSFVRPGMEFFTIFGQVQRQGKYELPLDEDVTISQAILKAGGPAQFANLHKVKLIRKTKMGNKAVMINVEDIMKNGALEHDIYIRNNDVLIIPEKIASF